MFRTRYLEAQNSKPKSNHVCLVDSPIFSDLRRFNARRITHWQHGFREPKGAFLDLTSLLVMAKTGLFQNGHYLQLMWKKNYKACIKLAIVDVTTTRYGWIHWKAVLGWPVPFDSTCMSQYLNLHKIRRKKTLLTNNLEFLR